MTIYNYRQIQALAECHYPKSHRTFKGKGFLGFTPLGGMTTPQPTTQPTGTTRVIGEGAILADRCRFQYLVTEYNPQGSHRLWQ